MSDDLSPVAETVSEAPRRRRTSRSRARSGGGFAAALASLSVLTRKVKLALYLLILLGIVYLIVTVSWSYWSAKEIHVTYQSNMEKLQGHIVFPNGETPRILLVDNPAKLPPYPFFREARRNDVVAVFEKASLIAIYRPSMDRVVSMSTFEQGAATMTAASSTQQ